MKITNREIELWLDNDEGLYLWLKRSRMSKRAFIKQNKEVLKGYIDNVVNGTKRAHGLVY